MSKRIYLVSQDDDQGQLQLEQLVRAANKAQAIRHVAEARIAARVATQDDLVARLPHCNIEEAGRLASDPESGQD